MNNLVISDDGFHTLFSPKFDATYHSSHGSVLESLTVFLSAGFHYQRLRGMKEMSVFEMGFGTGLNAFLTLIEAEKYNTSVIYHTIEAFPIDMSVVEELNYPKLLKTETLQPLFQKMHLAFNQENIDLTDHFVFQKSICTLQEFKSNQRFDIIYFDAFAPTTQPELWDVLTMKKMYDLLNAKGVLVTYCAKGSFKRALRDAGFEVQSLSGPPGKREMTRGVKR